MTSLVTTIPDQTYIDETEPMFRHEPKMRFDPNNKSLLPRAKALGLTVGSTDLSFPRVILRSGTNPNTTEQTFSPTSISGATAISKWTKLPTLADYENIEESNDLQETETAFYKTSKRFGW